VQLQAGNGVLGMAGAARGSGVKAQLANVAGSWPGYRRPEMKVWRISVSMWAGGHLSSANVAWGYPAKKLHQLGPSGWLAVVSG